MAPLESLPPDQRAVLQLVLQRGRTYDEIAAMLSIDRAAVRDRALSAFDTIGPPTRVAPERRALITDYLMGQLPPRIAEQIFERLKTSPAERAWARSLASDLSTLARGPLPDIPSSVDSTPPAVSKAPAARTAPEAPAAPEEPPAPEPTARTVVDTVAEDDDADEAPAPRPRRQRTPSEQVSAALGSPVERGEEDDAGYGRRDDAGDRDELAVSRRGGAIFIFGGVLVAAAILVVAIILLNNGGSSKSPSAPVAQSSGTSATSTPTAPTSTPTSTSTAATSTPTGTSTSSAAAAGGTGASGTSGANGEQVVAQLDLKTPSGATSPVGVAQIVKQSGKEGIVLVATGVTANTKHNAYAVWLYASASHTHLLGFVNPAVGATGRLETAGVLPANAASYHQVLVTLETQSHPSGPGTIVLRGALNIK